jgi:hypothetical protein
MERQMRVARQTKLANRRAKREETTKVLQTKLANRKAKREETTQRIQEV